MSGANTHILRGELSILRFIQQIFEHFPTCHLLSEKGVFASAPGAGRAGPRGLLPPPPNSGAVRESERWASAILCVPKQTANGRDTPRHWRGATPCFLNEMKTQPSSEGARSAGGRREGPGLLSLLRGGNDLYPAVSGPTVPSSGRALSH